MTRISALPAETAPTSTDSIPMLDQETMTTKRTTLALLQPMDNPYKFSVYRVAAANTGNNAFAQVVFDTELFDTNNNFASGTYTAPISGFYHFDWCVGIANSGTAQATIASLFVNGTRKRDGQRLSTTNLSINSTGSTLVQLTAGDTVDIRAFCASTQPLIVPNQYDTYFTGHLVSRT